MQVCLGCINYGCSYREYGHGIEPSCLGFLRNLYLLDTYFAPPGYQSNLKYQ